MTYLEFNKSIFEYYLKRANSSFFTLSIDSKEVEKIVEIDLIRSFSYLQNDWGFLLHNDNRIPKYFGLLAVQCLAASLMKNDNLSSDKAYNTRLMQLLNLNDNGCLQALFKGVDSTNPIQEQIWYHAKNYLKREYNLNLNIPSKKTDAGRFVQYPKSQALLNIEDLKRFTFFFAQEFEVKEDIPLEYFKIRLEACFYNLNRTNRTDKLWEDNDKREQCIKQLFSYYNLWEGEIDFTAKTNKTVILSANPKYKTEEKDSKGCLILSFEEDKPKFYVVGLNKDETFAISLNEVEKYKLVNHEFLIFNKSEYYENEFENSRFLYLGTCSFVLINKRTITSSIYRYFEGNNTQKFSLSDTLIIYYINVHAGLVNPLIKYMQKAKPITLVGGLKINRNSEYFLGYGPSILSDFQTTVLFENRKVEYHPKVEKAGHYTVRVDYCKDVSFDLIEATGNSHFVSQNEYGWNLTTFSIDRNFDLQGINLKDGVNSDNIIRSWISVNTQKSKMKNNTSNILINALNNSFNDDWKS